MEKRKKHNLNKYCMMTKMKFWGGGMTGLLIFVIPMEIGGIRQIGLVHLGTCITAILGGASEYVICGFAVGGVILIARERKKRFSGFFNSFMTCMSLMGTACIALYILDLAPSFLMEERFMPFIMKQVLYPTLLYTGISPFFMPFLLNWGLLESVGVLFKPILRPLFKLPGRAAVITVSAFFGSAPVGIITVDNLYKDGRFTHKEAFFMGTSFSTTAISFMVILSELGEITEFWGIYFFACLAGLALIAIVMVRIYPTAGQPVSTYGGQVYEKEEDTDQETALFIRMLEAGYKKAGNALGLRQNCISMVRNSGTLLCNMIGSSCGMVILGLLLNYYTPILDWAGYLFYPFALFSGCADPMTVGKGAAAALVVPSLPAVYAAMEENLVSKIVLCSMPVLSIVSIPLTMPVFFNTTVKYSAKDLFLIYVERMILNIIIVSAIIHFYIWF
nr:nucleoside recognition domain-containing protein [uncultured Schaedlerella sp.]